MGRVSATVLARVVGLQQLVQFAIDFASSLVIARVLTPQEIGAFSIATATLVIVQAFRTVGINIFLVQEAELTQPKVRSALGLAMAFSIPLAAVIWCASAAVGRFYESAAVTTVLQISALSYLIAPIHVTVLGLLTRELRVKAIMIAALLGSIVGATVTITLALAEFGSVSLAWGAFANSLAASIAMLTFRPHLFSFVPRLSGWNKIWTLSGWAAGSTLVNTFGGRLNELVVGKTLGLTQSALLDRAETLPRMVWTYLSPPVLNVMSSLMARELREGSDITQLTLFRMRLFASIFVPVLIGLGTQSETLLIGLYGEQWRASVPPAFWLCLSSAIVGQFVVLNSALIALGRTKHLFLLTLLEQLSRVVMLLLLGWTNIRIIGFGMNMVALTYAVSAVIIGKRLGIFGLGQLWNALRPAAMLGGLIWGAGSIYASRIDQFITLDPLAKLSLSIFVLALVWLTAAALIERDTVRLLRKVLFAR